MASASTVTWRPGVLHIDERTIAFREAGTAGNPGVVFVHGGAAHGGWWEQVAAEMSSDHHVIVPDLSGHGDSSHTAVYGFDSWADEVLAVAGRVSAGSAPTLVGHSVGGMVCLRAATRDVGLSGVVVVDASVRQYAPEELERWVGNCDSPQRVQPNVDRILDRFTLFDQARGADREVIARLGRQAIKPQGGGWVWKFDRRTFRHATPTPADLRPVAVPVALVRGDAGDMPPDICDAVQDGIGQSTPVHVIEGAGHHVMVDRPARLTQTLRQILANWHASRAVP